MSSDWLSTILWGMAALLIAVWIYINIRYRPQTTKAITSLKDVEGQIEKRPFTLVQFFAPM